MEADPAIVPNKDNLAQERLKATPQDSDMWLDSASESLEDDDSNQDDELLSDKEEKESLPAVKEQGEPKVEQLDVKKQKEQGKVSMRLAEDEQMREMKDFLTVTHTVKMEFIVLLRIMSRINIVNLTELCGLKGEGRIDFPAKGNKMIILATSKQKATDAINVLSDYIDDLNIQKVDVRPEFARKIQSFHRFRHEFKERKIYIFGADSDKGFREVWIGGRAKTSQLRKIAQELKAYKILNFSLKQIRNKRSYKLIFGEIFQLQKMQKALMAYNKVSLIEVDKKNKDRCLKYFCTSTSKVEISPVEYEEFIYKELKNFYVITFVLRRQKYFPKLQIQGHPEIRFKIIHQFKVGIAYLLIICERQTFFKQNKLIEEQLSKLGQWIIGVRFFNYLEPSFRFFNFDSESHLIRKFPNVDTYSMCVSAKTREGHKFQWREVFALFLQLIDKQEMKVRPEEDDSLID